MPATRDDIRLLLEVERTLKPSTEAKKFAWSKEVEQADGFFDRYGWNSDERFHVNEFSTYFELCGLIWKQGLVDEALLFDWVPAVSAWHRVGPVLLEARRVLGSEELWTNFEAFAAEQERRDNALR